MSRISSNNSSSRVHGKGGYVQIDHEAVAKSIISKIPVNDTLRVTHYAKENSKGKYQMVLLTKELNGNNNLFRKLEIFTPTYPNPIINVKVRVNDEFFEDIKNLVETQKFSFFNREITLTEFDDSEGYTHMNINFNFEKFSLEQAYKATFDFIVNANSTMGFVPKVATPPVVIVQKADPVPIPPPIVIKSNVEIATHFDEKEYPALTKSSNTTPAESIIYRVNIPSPVIMQSTPPPQSKSFVEVEKSVSPPPAKITSEAPQSLPSPITSPRAPVVRIVQTAVPPQETQTAQTLQFPSFESMVFTDLTEESLAMEENYINTLKRHAVELNRQITLISDRYRLRSECFKQIQSLNVATNSINNRNIIAPTPDIAQSLVDTLERATPIPATPVNASADSGVDTSALLPTIVESNAEVPNSGKKEINPPRPTSWNEMADMVWEEVIDTSN
jgi:hypothetical protein